MTTEAGSVTEPTCAADGHDLEFIITGTGDLIQAYCARCKRHWRMEET